MKLLLIGLAIAALSLFLFLGWASYPWSLTSKSRSEQIIRIEPEGNVGNEDHPAVIKVQTWNIGYLFGLGSEGPGYEARSKDFYQKKLDELVAEIKASAPDVLCLQEVDFQSDRSQSINQARYLAQKAAYPYVAEAVSWEANYIPFPYWPFSRHFGRMRSGGAILSKYPITDHQVHLLDKPLSQPWWYNLFYLHRYVQKVTIEFGEKKISLINLHLEAFDKEDRRQQLAQLAARVKDEKVQFVAGDFNMVPSSATKKSRFLDSTDDYENDPSYEVMKKSGLSEVIPDSIYTLNESAYFTFPSNRPDRRLDYIFFDPRLKMIKAEVLPSALSDHLPLQASIQIGNPVFNPY
jgi:endonuclease/exonuclease/phosphatase family metal-dependent hydrolase